MAAFSVSLLTFLVGVVVLLVAEAMRSLVSPLSSDCLLKPAVVTRLVTSASPTGFPCCTAATEVLTTTADLGRAVSPKPPLSEMGVVP